ncbi:hypothetical protein K490DRAFT_74457 [Saccharata proteae CBS 121410]|uniref:Amino acid transporter n=1 Tax=Saccharata proteae CBS 121410 TaxID=1314787 RepID=A0A9P4LXX5_9PEZI|nr:hypothetical protein K490DRAFT_74457 [Saccharata proteae CBS 121410]
MGFGASGVVCLGFVVLRQLDWGLKQELKRHFAVFSLIGLASITTIFWTGLGPGLVTEVDAGGPGAAIYGFVLAAILQSFLAASLAEFVSAYPTEGGICHWVAAIAPRRYSGLLSFTTGWWSVSSRIFTPASTNLLYAQNSMALIALYHDTLVIKTSMTFVVYQITNIATAGVVLLGNRIIPAMNRLSSTLTVSPNQLAWFILLVTVAATALSHNDAKLVFRTWINETGWQNKVICFITGLVNPLSALSGLDGITHISEETPNPFRKAPLALLRTLSIAFVTGLSYLLALMFSVQDYAALSNSSTGLLLAELFRQVTQSRGGAFALVFLLWIAWALRSSAAFNAMLGSAVTINSVAYLIPVLTNVLQRRKVLVKGKFHVGAVPGRCVALGPLAWLTLAIIFFSFPYEQPVSAANMNYTCVCVGGIGAVALG